jgi:hypothetical protein
MLNTFGSKAITFAQLQDIPTPAPIGPRHQPYPFADYVDQIKDHLDRFNLEVVDETYTTSMEDQRFFGVLQLCRHDHRSSEDYAPLLGLRGSHDQSCGRGFAIGASVYVCTNMSFRSDHTFSTKQTTNIERRLPLLIDRRMAMLGPHLDAQDSFFDQLRLTKLSTEAVNQLMVETVRQAIVPPSSFGRLLHEWDQPTYEAHAEDGDTAWRFHNAVTEVLKPVNEFSSTSLRTVQGRTIRLNNLLEEVIA